MKRQVWLPLYKCVGLDKYIKGCIKMFVCVFFCVFSLFWVLAVVQVVISSFEINVSVLLLGTRGCLESFK